MSDMEINCPPVCQKCHTCHSKDDECRKMPFEELMELISKPAVASCAAGETTSAIPAPKPLTGWKCPVCGRGNSPWMSFCPCVQLPPAYPTYPPYCPPICPDPYPYPTYPTYPWVIYGKTTGTQ